MRIWSSEELIRAANINLTTIDIAAAAERLGVCEFDLFRQAYVAWHREGFNDERVGRFYMIYAEEGTAPVWLHEYVRALEEDLSKCGQGDTVLAVA